MGVPGSETDGFEDSWYCTPKRVFGAGEILLIVGFWLGWNVGCCGIPKRLFGAEEILLWLGWNVGCCGIPKRLFGAEEILLIVGFWLDCNVGCCEKRLLELVGWGFWLFTDWTCAGLDVNPNKFWVVFWLACCPCPWLDWENTGTVGNEEAVLDWFDVTLVPNRY